MASELEPWAGSGDVVGGAFSLDFDQNFGVLYVFTVPRVEGLQELETVRTGGDVDCMGRAVSWWVVLVVLTSEPSLAGQFVAIGRLELELFAIWSGEFVALGVKVEVARDGVDQSSKKL